MKMAKEISSSSSPYSRIHQMSVAGPAGDMGMADKNSVPEYWIKP